MSSFFKKLKDIFSSSKTRDNTPQPPGPGISVPPAPRQHVSETLYSSLMSGSVEQVKEFIDVAGNINESKGYFGSRPLLHYLVSNYYSTPEIIEYAISKGADPNASDEQGRNALFHIHVFKTEFIDILLRHGADINRVSASGKNLLFECTSHMPFIDVYIDKGINVNHKDPSGFNILYELVHMGTPAIIKKLIDKGIEFNYVPSDDQSQENFFMGYSSLHYYIYYHKFSLAKVLIENGADLELRTTMEGRIASNENMTEYKNIPAALTARELFYFCQEHYLNGAHPEDYDDINSQVSQLEQLLQG